VAQIGVVDKVGVVALTGEVSGILRIGMSSVLRQRALDVKGWDGTESERVTHFVCLLVALEGFNVSDIS
jgi:hypothetical protein